MKYSIDYQFLSKGHSRPADDGEVIGIQANSGEGSLVVLPNVGDFVRIDGDTGHAGFAGRVRSRVFFYTRTNSAGDFCSVNIVVEETDDDWGKLIKE